MVRYFFLEAIFSLSSTEEVQTTRKIAFGKANREVGLTVGGDRFTSVTCANGTVSLLRVKDYFQFMTEH